MVRPCEESERGAHSEKNARCGHTKEDKGRAEKPRSRDACNKGGFILPTPSSAAHAATRCAVLQASKCVSVVVKIINARTYKAF